MALIFPGGGQWASGSKGKAALFTLAGIGGAAVALLGVSSTKSAAEQAVAANTSRDQEGWNSARSKHSSGKTLAVAGGGAVTAAWLLGIADAAMHRSRVTNALSLGVRPVASGDRTLFEGQIGVTVPLDVVRR